MTQIKPLRGVHYNKEKVSNLSEVVCPPYDVISEEEQNDFYNSNPYNFIRILLGKEYPHDDRNNNRYTRAKDDFKKWLKKGILVEDEEESLYFYKQEFRIQGEKYSRLGFICLMKLQNEEDSKVYPHENTHSSAKEDRLRLWSTAKANLSPIFVCFSDPQKKAESVFHKNVSARDPLIDVVDSDDVRHLIWKLSDPVLVKEVVERLQDQQLFIADGHHRYEVALEYRRQRLERLTKPTGQESFNYVMTYFANMDSRDLRIFPMHRIIKSLSGPLDFLGEFFRVDHIKTKEEFLLLLAKAGRNEHAFGLYGRDGMKLLRLKNKTLIDRNISEGSKEFRSLDATILKNFILDRVGVKSEDIIYTKDSDEAMSAVETSKAEVSFLMNPVQVQQLKAIALNGERMPPKTTYFYPKVLSGLTVYRYD